MPSPAYDRLFETIEEMVMQHSPSGVEGEIDRVLSERFKALGLECRQDGAGNLVAELRGRREEALAITAHKDEIGGMVKGLYADGRVQVRALGGAFPWVYGEGIVDLLGDRAVLPGVLSFGSRHVSHESPQKLRQDEAPLRWQDAWVETKCRPHELEAAGVRPGTRMVIGKHRKRPFRIKDHIASYTLDNKASLAILLGVAERLRSPGPTVYLVASAKEEVGGLGALYFTQRQDLDALIALEIAPLAPEYPIQDGEAPVLLSQDGYGLYDEGLNAALRHAAEDAGIAIQHAAIAGFGSDGSMAMKYGHVARAACLGFPTQNTHGYEIAHLGAIENCIAILCAYCAEGRAPRS